MFSCSQSDYLPCEPLTARLNDPGQRRQIVRIGLRPGPAGLLDEK